MTKTTRNLALLAAFSIIVAGCTTLLNTQANSWADQAEQIARNCPAAAEKAAEARRAANKAADITSKIGALDGMRDHITQLDNRINSLWQDARTRGYVEAPDPATITPEVREQRLSTALTMRESADKCRRMDASCEGCTDAAICAGMADYWERSARRAEIAAGMVVPEELFNAQERFGIVRDQREEAAACRRNAERWRDHGWQTPGAPAGLEACDVYDRDTGNRHECHGLAECQAEAEGLEEAANGNEAWASGAGGRADQLREQLLQARHQRDQILIAFREKRSALLDEISAAGIAVPEIGGESLETPAAAVQQWVEGLGAQSQGALNETRRISSEQCGEGAALKDAPPQPSTVSGDYPQDILNSQPMGLPVGPAPLACCSTDPMCAICTGGCPAFCSACNTGC